MTHKHFCLTLQRAPGDVVVLTALARDLALMDPTHRVFVECAYPELLRHNPRVRPAAGVVQAYPDVLHVQAEYGRGISGPAGQKYRAVHFLRWLYEDFAEKTGVDVPITAPHGDLHFGPEEAGRLVTGRYWVLAAGGKSDFPAKVWDPASFQAVADALRAAGLGVVQVGQVRDRGTVKNLPHSPLEGAVDLVGRTSLRDLLRVIRDADGVVGGVSMPMHAAAALGRPCVVIGGARESWLWEGYVNENRGFGAASGTFRVPHRFLHTFGVHDCREKFAEGPHQGGCWRRGLDEGSHQRCYDPVPRSGGGPGLVAGCLARITPDHVVAAIMSYYEDATLPPIAERPRPVAASVAAVAPPPGADLEPVVPLLPGAAVRGGAAPAAASPLDSPVLGGRLTAFVLMYGDYPEMHRECLGALLRTTTPDRLEIRIASNELCDESVAFVDKHVADGRCAVHYRNPANDRKYPVMRRIFRDPARPVETPYLLWLDDDSIVEPGWLDALAQTIAEGHVAGARLFGPRYVSTYSPAQVAWLKAAPWYRGRPLQDVAGNESPNLTRVVFASGSCWALATDVMRGQDIPDARLAHNGGDICIGAQVWQGGWSMRAFSQAKSPVRWSAYARRGLSEKHPAT